MRIGSEHRGAEAPPYEPGRSHAQSGETALLAVEHAVARILAETAEPEDAYAKILEAIGETLGWEFGAIWETPESPDEPLRCLDTWCASSASTRTFSQVSRLTELPPGQGLPGRVWASGEPAWVVDVQADPSFHRAGAAADAGLQAAFCFPVRSAKGVLGAIEFLSSELREPDGALLATVASLGSQIGQFVERRRAEEAVRDSEGRKQAMLDSALDCVIAMNHRGQVVEFNPAAEQTFGYRRADVIGREMAELIIPPALREHHRRGLARYLETGEARELDRRIEVTGMRADGSEFPVELAITRIDVPGPPMFTGYIRDITERRHAQLENERLQRELQAQFNELQRERDFLRTVANTTPSLLCVIDPEGRIVRFNKACEETTGYDDDEGTRGRYFWDVFIAPEEVDAVRKKLAEVRAGHPPVEHETLWQTRTSERRVIAWSSTPLVDEHGRDRYLVCGVDITERKRQEDELRRLYGELQARLRDLRASRARIVEAAEAERRRLERNLHDGAQQRFVTLSLTLRLALRHLTTDPAAAEQLLRKATEELAVALDELRELARGIHPAILSERGLAPALEALAARSPLPVEVAMLLDERLPEAVEAASYYLVSEALTNAAKYAQASQATVHVSGGDGLAVIEVSDDGIGGADAARGSGLLGLADRIEALDGRLEVTSVPGAGTRVRAEIPLGSS